MSRGRESTGGETGGELVVAANRLPISVHRGSGGLEAKPSPGGLVSALEPVLRKRGGTWVGWPGIALRPHEELHFEDLPYRLAPVGLSEAEIRRYYYGFSNRTLWPLLHSMPDRARFERRDFEVYDEVNQRFAEAVRVEADRAALVWIHDYQLMQVPQKLRHDTEARIAFFLHIPFPPYDLFRLLPWDRELLEGLLGADLIGFHTHGYAWNFLDCVERRLGTRVDREAMLIEFGDRTVRVGAFPIGIDFEAFEARARDGSAGVDQLAGGKRDKLILGVDRLDYTKGIPERFRAFERLLEKHPSYREHVTLLQIAVPSRSQVAAYRELKREIDELVGRINGRFATAQWSPIRYLYRSFDQDRLALLYRDSDVALITPLRDGMNLVAKEYVACQVANPGVLVLSSLAGASETMREALALNPLDVAGSAETLHRALSMGEEERASRMAALRRRERRDNIDHWVQSFLEAGQADVAALAPITGADFEAWLSPHLKRYRLALFLDYDGTLTPLVEHPSKAQLSEETRRALHEIQQRGDTDIAIVSGRSLADVEGMVGIDGVVYAGNHGLEINGHDIDLFLHEDLVHYRMRTEELAKDLSAAAVEGAWTEVKGPTLTFHYREAPRNLHSELVERAIDIIHDAGYQAREAHYAVEARPPIGWDKGRAVLHVLRTRYGPAWSERVRVIYVGDDQTDEDAFRLLAGLAVTFRVGPAHTPTLASRRLPNVGGVEALLGWLAQRAAHDG
jgi:trehalose 6-phosphate synthase/phosphatase